MNRDAFIQHLASKEVPCMIYYPVPGHLQKMFGSNTHAQLQLDVTNALTPVVCSLPIHTEMEEDQLLHIVEAVKSFIQTI
jgi:dTDP-4-amino-4,6-dideoxygalactose transaminase